LDNDPLRTGVDTIEHASVSACGLYESNGDGEFALTTKVSSTFAISISDLCRPSRGA